MLVEDCPQELFPVKSVCEVETWEGEREAEEDQVCQRQHLRRNWSKAKLFFSVLCITGNRLPPELLCHL